VVKLILMHEMKMSMLADPLVEPKPPSLSFSPRAIKNIQRKLKAFRVTGTPTVESLYGSIMAIFEEHGQERRTRNANTPESWFRFLPGPVRLVSLVLLYSMIISIRYIRNR
jgi:hypothetical protein